MLRSIEPSRTSFPRSKGLGISGEDARATVTHYENPALTVDAVWIRRGRVLLGRRAHPPFVGQWALPGGFVELRETVEQTVVRELAEETALRAHPVAIVGVYSGPDRDPRKPTTTVAFLMRGRGAAPTGGSDAAAARWVPLAEARSLAFDHDRILRDALRMLGIRRHGRPGRPAVRAPEGEDGTAGRRGGLSAADRRRRRATRRPSSGPAGGHRPSTRRARPRRRARRRNRRARP